MSRQIIRLIKKAEDAWLPHLLHSEKSSYILLLCKRRYFRVFLFLCDNPHIKLLSDCL